jgi:hypothetical protein
MRFRNLKGLTSLPVDAVKHRFRNEQVLTVLPVYGDVAGRDSLLVATPSELTVVSRDPRRSDRWMTTLAPWGVVRLDEAASHPDDDIHRLDIHIGNLTFHAALAGPKGQRGLSDFVMAARAQHEAIAAPA